MREVRLSILPQLAFVGTENTVSEASGWVELWILRVGRRFCIILGTLAVVAIMLGAIALVATGLYWLVGQPGQPSPPPALERPGAISIDDARKNADPSLKFDHTSQDVPRVRTATLEKVAALKDLFPEPQYFWDDVYDDKCRVRTSYGCMEHSRTLTRRGVARFVAFLLEQVPADDNDIGTDELRRVLKDVPVEERANLVAPVLIANLKQRVAQKKLAAARDAEIQKAQSDYDDRVSTFRGRLFLMATVGGSGVGYGLLVALSLCLLVAILAIERHLRTPNLVP
jgi:hypothetical protein